MRVQWLLMCAPALVVLSAWTGCSNDAGVAGDTGGVNGGSANGGSGSGTQGGGGTGGHVLDSGHPSSGGDDASTGGGGDDDGSTGGGGDDATTGGKDSSTGGGGGKDSSTGVGADCNNPNLVWKKAEKTNFTSYPAPGSPECVQYNGCAYEGQFAACSNTEPLAWVKAHNIVSVFPNFNALKLHDLCLKSGSNTIVVTVLDECADSDCSGCCTQNAKPSGNLIDIESFTDARWGVDDGQIEFADLGPTTGGGCH